MHMSDALISASVGGGGWLAAAGFTALSARQLERTPMSSQPALMGVLGAFAFAAQMVNFSLPGTGSSGHIGGGLLLAALLGPHAAFIAIASVLTLQALVFADGGLLALGCNALNLGVIPCFVAYPLVFRPLAGSAPSRARLSVAALLAALVGLFLGSLAVVLETTASGIARLPFLPFLAVMIPIHLGIGTIEGLVTGSVLVHVRQARPDLLRLASGPASNRRPLRSVLVAFGVTAALTAGALSWLASSHPDGLEWSVARVSGGPALPTKETGLHALFARVQRATALLPDYSADATRHASGLSPSNESQTSLAGLLGAGLTALLILALGFALRWTRRWRRSGRGDRAPS